MPVYFLFIRFVAKYEPDGSMWVKFLNSAFITQVTHHMRQATKNFTRGTQEKIFNTSHTAILNRDTIWTENGTIECRALYEETLVAGFMGSFVWGVNKE